MGRYDFSAHKVHAHATNLLKTRKLKVLPPWYNAVASNPPAEILTRPVLQKKARKSRNLKPAAIPIPEDKLRWDFYNDHPWELARPRVVLENDGRDHTRWNWGHALCRPRAAATDAKAKQEVEQWDEMHMSQSARPLNGEAVVQRQQWLIHNEQLSEAAAYDKARKEFYRARHMQEVEQRVAREEATFYGGIFGMGAMEVGMQLEDKAFEDFKQYAGKRIVERKSAAQSAYTGQEVEDAEQAEQADTEEATA